MSTGSLQVSIYFFSATNRNITRSEIKLLQNRASLRLLQAHQWLWPRDINCKFLQRNIAISQKFFLAQIKLLSDSCREAVSRHVKLRITVHFHKPPVVLIESHTKKKNHTNVSCLGSLFSQMSMCVAYLPKQYISGIDVK